MVAEQVFTGESGYFYFAVTRQIFADRRFGASKNKPSDVVEYREDGY